MRFTQQYNSTFKPNTARYGHRIRSEQRIFNQKTIYRFRYRFALDTPLNGEQLDLGEAYVLASIESLISLSRSSKPQYDQRFNANIGWLIFTNTKLQTGFEYRFEDYTKDTEDVLFILTSLIVSL